MCLAMTRAMPERAETAGPMSAADSTDAAGANSGEKTAALDRILGLSPVIPVAVVDDAAQAVALGRALLSGGIAVLEITLRSAAALPAIRALRAELPELKIGCGTLRSPAQIESAVESGAHFLVSPGAPPGLAQALAEASVPALPGAATPTEMMQLAKLGFARQKFFPAESAGGAKLLQAIAPVLPELRFCPTGGITEQSAAAYLRCPNVACIGASWLAPPPLLRTGDFATIESHARRAAALR